MIPEHPRILTLIDQQYEPRYTPIFCRGRNCRTEVVRGRKWCTTCSRKRKPGKAKRGR